MEGLITFRHVGFENFDWDVLAVMLGRLAVAALLGAVVAYRWWRKLMPFPFDRTESGAQVLIAVAGALIVTVIGNNVALAFGLVGLGGFIRFRSGIKDPREAGVMFLMIGIGMASGVGLMPVALTATAFGVVLLAVLDVVEKKRRQPVRRRLRFKDVDDPRKLEPRMRAAIEKATAVRGSKINPGSREVVVDVVGDAIKSAGEALDVLRREGVELSGDVSCEEM
jgi:hypothetical protein